MEAKPASSQLCRATSTQITCLVSWLHPIWTSTIHAVPGVPASAAAMLACRPRSTSIRDGFLGAALASPSLQWRDAPNASMM